jgi:hypothetical protein
MRPHYCILFMLFVFLSCSGSDIIDETDNPNVISASSINADNSMYVAFPSIASNPSQSRIVVVFREGETHTSFDGKIIQVESYDKGKSWSDKHIIYTPPVGSDARDPQLLTLNDGTLLCRFFERSTDSTSVIKCLRSSNYGVSYDSAVTFPFPNSKIHFAAARGNMALVDNTIYSVCYGKFDYSWLIKSNDSGKSWQYISAVDAALGTAKSSFNRINEASLGYIDGTLNIIARETSAGLGFIQWGESSNKGSSWDWSFLPFKGHAPSLSYFKDNTYVTTFRNVTDTTNYSFDLALIRDGSITKGPITLFKSTTSDMGYGDLLFLPNYFIVCCYQPGRIRCYLIDYNIFSGAN